MENDIVVYQGDTYRVQSSGRYYQSDKKDVPHRLLHRRIWSDHFGEIPPNHHIHHIDENWRNNDISNLECIYGPDHLSHHKSEQIRQNPKQNQEWLEMARVKAAEWHRSEEGREWHSKNGKASWVGREPTSSNCSVCNTEYETFFASRSRFCSTSCAQKVAYKRHFTDTRVCAWCGDEFLANRYRTTACCSRTCANQKRAHDEHL